MGWEWVAPTLVALLVLFETWRARKSIKHLHVEVNSRLSQLLDATRGEAASKGHAAGVEAERIRQAKEGDSS